MAERKEWWEILRDQFASRGLLDPESERLQEAAQAAPAVQRQARGLLSLDPQAESDTALEIGLGSLPGVGQAMALRDLERARRAKDPGAAAMAASNFIPFGTLLNRFRRGPMSELDVYHGTPHRFPATEANPLGEFDASKIGSGEGAQAYGHGIYLAEDPDVAKTYQSAQSPSARKATMTLQAFDGNVNKAIAAMKKEVATMTAHKDSPYLRQGAFQETQDALNYLQQMKKGAAPQTGALYTADLPDEMIDRMLDWDKPFNQQSPNAQKAIKDALEVRKRQTGGYGLFDPLEKSSIKDLVGSIGEERLRQAGIPGIRYLDRQSRIYGKPKFFVENVSADGKVINSFRFDTREEAEKFSATFKKQMKRQLPPEKIGTPRITEREAQQTTSNFVVFPGEEKKVKILERK
jgi:hypothetical protein